MQEDFSTVHKSFGRALTKNPKLIYRFYEIFTASHPDIAPFFKNTDFDRQVSLLRQGLNMALLFAEGKKTGEMVINKIRETHNRSGFNVPPRLYPYWVSSLIQAISESDPQFNPDLERQWRKALQKAVDHIKGGY